MHFFGYVENPSDPENLTPFFKYNEDGDDDFTNYNGFKKHNQSVLNKLG